MKEYLKEKLNKIRRLKEQSEDNIYECELIERDIIRTMKKRFGEYRIEFNRFDGYLYIIGRPFKKELFVELNELGIDYEVDNGTTYRGAGCAEWKDYVRIKDVNSLKKNMKELMDMYLRVEL